MTQINATTLADKLGVTPGRVSQYVAEGKLAGCYTGTGRQRRFDLAACADALGKRLDQGQMMGNGAETRRAIGSIRSGTPSLTGFQAEQRQKSRQSADGEATPDARGGAGASELSPSDPDRYELARTQKAQEEARRLRRMNAEAEGRYVLASEVELQMRRVLAQEMAEVESLLRDGARKIADAMKVDYKGVRKILIDAWRDHRSARSAVLADQSQAAQLSDAERDDDI
jgi:hypothetical protein